MAQPIDPTKPVIKTQPATDAYREGWERIFGARCQVCGGERVILRPPDGAPEACPECRVDD